jgi:hypothetical protein
MKPNKNFHFILKSIDDITDFDIILYKCTEKDDECFCLLEQSSLQVLRELPFDLQIKVEEIFSQRHRIAQRVEMIKSCSTIEDFFDAVLPLIENGSFPCDTLTITIDGALTLQSHDDGEVTLSSNRKELLRGLIERVLVRQGFESELLNEVIRRPNLYHKLQKPNEIKASYQTFEEVLNAM